MALKEEGGQYVFEKRWGRLRYGILPVHTKTMEQVFSDQQKDAVEMVLRQAEVISEDALRL